MRRVVVGLLVAISALALVLSSTSLWTRRHVVNTDVFVAGAEKIVADPAVQARLEAGVVSAIMANPQVQQAISQTVEVLPPRLRAFRPTIAEGAQSLLTRGVRTVLTSAAFTTLTTAALRNAHTQLIDGQSIRLTVGQAKAVVPPENRTGLAGQVLNLIPDNLGITVLTKEQAPQVYTIIDLLKSLWLWVGLISLAALAGALVVSRRRRKTLRAWSVTTGVIGLLLVLTLAIARGPVLGQVKPANVSAAQAVYDGVTASLRSWTLWLALIMLGIMVVTLLWGRIGIIPALRRGYHSARDRGAAMRQQRADAGDSGEAAAESWPRRVAVSTRAFTDGLNLPERLGALASFLRRNLRAARWIGIAVGGLVLLFWPSPTLSTLIWVAAAVALYIGLIELVMSLAPGAPEADADSPALADGDAPAPVVAHRPAFLDRSARAAPGGTHGRGSNARRPASAGVAVSEPVRHGVAPADLAAMGGRLDLLMRLGDARTAGVLTDEEFAREKADLLAL